MKNFAVRHLKDWPDQNVIYSVAPNPVDGNVYLGLSSEMDKPGSWGRLLSYDPVRDCFNELADLKKIIKHSENSLRHPHSKIHTAMHIAQDGKVLFATHMTAPPKGEDHYHFWQVYNDPERCFDGSHLLIYDPKTARTEDFGIIAPRCGCRWLGYNPELEELYITTFLTCHFIVVRLKTGEVKDLGRISQYDYMGPTYSADGRVYTTDSKGMIIRYTPEKELLERLPVQVPGAPGVERDGTGVYQFMARADLKKLYGVCWNGMRFFEYDPQVGKYGEMRDYGTVNITRERKFENVFNPLTPRAFTTAGNNLVYAAMNSLPPHNKVSLMSLELDSGSFNYHGEIGFAGYPVCGITSMATDSSGTLYMGTETRASNHPLQFIIFNPEGVNLDTQLYEGSEDLPHQQTYLFHRPKGKLNQVFCPEGSFFAQELGMSGRREVIPRGVSAIQGLTLGKYGMIFGATASKYFVFLPQTKKLLPLGDLPSKCRCVVADPKGNIYWGTKSLLFLDFSVGESDYLLRDFQDRGEFQHYRKDPTLAMAKLQDFGSVGSEIIAMTWGDKLYGITEDCIFFSFDPQTKKINKHDIFDQYVMQKANMPRALVYVDEKIWFSGHHGMMIAYDIKSESFIETSAKIPVSSGREYLNSASALIKDCNGTIYGGTSESGCLFKFNPESCEIINLGKNFNENSIRALTLGNDGVIWGIAGTDEQISHLFKYDGQMTDCGIMRAKMPKTWVVHRADVMVTGQDGEIFIGEHDDISHLMIYYPPIQQMHKDNLY